MYPTGGSINLSLSIYIYIYIHTYILVWARHKTVVDFRKTPSMLVCHARKVKIVDHNFDWKSMYGYWKLVLDAEIGLCGHQKVILDAIVGLLRQTNRRRQGEGPSRRGDKHFTSKLPPTNH